MSATGADEAPLIRVDVSGLTVQGRRGSFVEYWTSLWDARHFIYHTARAKIAEGNRREKLGNLWLVITPIFNGLTYYVIFGLVLQSSRGIENFIGFLTIGIFMFAVATRGISQGADAIYTQRNIGRGAPYSSLVKVTVVNVHVWLASIPSYIVMLLLIIIIPPVETITPLALLALPVIALQALMVWGFALVAAHFVARLADLKHVLSLLLRAWFFGSGVFFSVDRILNALPAIKPLVDFNPMHHVLDSVRNVLLYAQPPSLFGLAVMAFWAFAAVLAGSWILWWAEGSYSFDDES